MAHPEQEQFVRRVKAWHTRFFTDVDVLEFGARNVNGSVRSLFSVGDGHRYVGVDCVAGQGVDVVSLAHDYVDPQGHHSFDVVCSCEMLEHDPYARASVRNMLAHLRSGGLLIVTCAGDGRREHGTRRTTRGPVYGPFPDFYRNVSMSALLDWCGAMQGTFCELFVQHNPAVCDLYFCGIRA